ncbi:hypothetical protein BH09BAC5_BH09BAC5_14360 [soil metagenome]
MKYIFLIFSIFTISCLDLDEEKREREAINGPDSLVKKEISPLDTVFMIHILEDQINVTGDSCFAYHTTWANVDTLLKHRHAKKPAITVYVEELASDPKTVDTVEDILIRNNIFEYTRFTNPKYPVYSKKYISKKE